MVISRYHVRHDSTIFILSIIMNARAVLCIFSQIPLEHCIFPEAARGRLPDLDERFSLDSRLV